MNRLVPIVLVVAAVFLHFSYCEWNICEHERIVSQSRVNRVIFCESNPASYDIYLLAKSADSRGDAHLWGLLVPVLFLAGAGLVTRIEDDTAAGQGM